MNKKSFFPCALLAVLLIPLAWPHLFFRGQIPVDGQVLRVLYPNWTFLRAHPVTIRHWPLWNPYRNMGEPFLADPISLAAYPPMWLLSRLSSILTFFRCWVLGHTLLAGTFMGLWVYKHTGDQPASIGAALVCMFNGFFMSRVTQVHHFASAAYVPMVLFYFDDERPIPLAIALALQWLGGFPSFSYVTVSLLVVWSLIERKSKPGLLLKSGLLAAALSAYQVIPFLELLMQSTRSLVLNPKYALENSQSWHQLAKIVLVPQWFAWHPQLEGDQAIVSFYVGPFVLAAAAWAAWKGGRKAQWAGVAAVFSSLLSLGNGFWGYAHIPLFRVLRFPANWLLLSAAALSFLCGVGLARLPSARWKWMLVGLIALDLLSFSQWTRVPWFEAQFLTRPPRLAEILGPVADSSRIYHPPNVTEGLASQRLSGFDDYLFIKEALAPSYGMSFGFHEVSSYDTIVLKRAAAYQNILAAQGPGSSYQKWAGISTVITRTPGSGPWGRENLLVVATKMYEQPAFFAAGSKASRVDVDRREPGRLALTTHADKEEDLVFSEIAYPGWRVAIDGREASLRLFQDTFMAVRVPAGEHSVVFSFRSLAVITGGAISVVAVFLMACITIRRSCL